MKHSFWIVIVLFCFADVCAQQKDEVFSEQNEIPEWVKRRVTIEEYDWLKTMSTVYRIDYDAFRGEMPMDFRKDLHETMKFHAERIAKGDYDESDKGTVFIFSGYVPTDTGLVWKLNHSALTDGGKKELRWKEAVICSSKDDCNVQIVCSVQYCYDFRTGEVTDIQSKSTLLFPSSIKAWVNGAAKAGEEIGATTLVYQENSKRLQGTFSGSFDYEKEGKRYCESMNCSFAFKP